MWYRLTCLTVLLTAISNINKIENVMTNENQVINK